MFRRPMLFSGLAMALLATPFMQSLPTIPNEPPRPRQRRSGKGRPGMTRSRQLDAAGFTSHGKRARQRRRTSHLRGRG